MSARYLPIAAPAQTEALRLSVAVADGGAAAAFFPVDAGAVGEEVELAAKEETGLLAARLSPGQENGVLVLTGLHRGGLPRDTTVEIGIAPPDAGDGEESGCQAARSRSVPGSAVLLLAALALLRLHPSRHHRAGVST